MKYSQFLLSALVTTIALTFLSHSLKAQITLPPKLLSTKSIGILSCKSAEKDCLNDTAKNFQTIFHKTGVDVVQWIEESDLYANSEARKILAKRFLNRGVEQLVFVSYDGTKYKMIWREFEVNSPSLTKEGAPFFEMESEDIRGIFQNFYRRVTSSSQKKENLLINESPEWLSLPKIAVARTVLNYAFNLKTVKLAVESEDAKLMTFYTKEFGIVESSIDDAALRKQGYQFKLFHIYGKPSAIRRILGFNLKSEGKENERYYKYYVKNLVNGDIYVGSNADEKESRATALEQHLLKAIQELN